MKNILLGKNLIGKKIIFRNSKGGIVQFQLKPNFELEQEILSLGENAIILSPTDLRDKIRTRIEKNLENYKSFSSREQIVSTFAADN